jgi:hypothetical protein
LEATDIEEVRQTFPGLAEEFIRLRDELDSSTRVDTMSQANPMQKNDGDRRRNASKWFDELLLEIQQKPGLKDFLGPLNKEQMYAAAALEMVATKCFWGMVLTNNTG